MTVLHLDGAAREFDLLFLDCDGVIFDTNAAKAAAFSQALASYPADAVERLVAYHKAHGGISRYEKFRRFFEQWHPVDDIDVAMQVALTHFGDISSATYSRLVPHPAALRFGDAFGPDRTYVASGADQQELRTAFAAHGIADRFAAILGSPTTKHDNMQDVLTQRGIAPERTLLVGDGLGDLEAAEALGTAFVFLESMSDWCGGAEVSRAHGWPVAETWSTLLGWLDGPYDGGCQTPL